MNQKILWLLGACVLHCIIFTSRSESGTIASVTTQLAPRCTPSNLPSTEQLESRHPGQSSFFCETPFGSHPSRFDSDESGGNRFYSATLESLSVPEVKVHSPSIVEDDEVGAFLKFHLSSNARDHYPILFDSGVPAQIETLAKQSNPDENALSESDLMLIWLVGAILAWQCFPLSPARELYRTHLANIILQNVSPTEYDAIRLWVRRSPSRHENKSPQSRRLTSTPGTTSAMESWL